METSTLDVVQYASQIGRLDFVSAVLAVLALILGLGAFPIFWFLKYRAETIAKKAAEDELLGAEARIEKVAIAKLELMLPELAASYFELAKNSVTAEQGNQIAQAAAREGDDDGKHD